MTKHWSQDVFETIGYMGAVTENMLMQSKRAANRVESEIQKFATMSTAINRDFKIDHEVRIGYLGVRTDEEEKLPLGGFATIMVTSLYKNGGMTVTLGLEVHGSEALGAKVDVPTMDGDVTLTVPPGTLSGGKLRLKGKGMPSGKSGDAAGDLLVRVMVDVPKEMTDAQRELFEKLRDEA